MMRQLVCVFWLVASTVAATAPPPNIILITLDTVRADRMGFLGSKRGLTPSLDQLASQSTVFSHAYAQVPLTAPSHATILTGIYPQFHHVQDFQTPLAKDLPFAPDILRTAGYSTAAFVGAMVLDPAMGLARGFDRGFDTYDAGFHQPAPGSGADSIEDRYHSVERRGADVVAHAVAWLNQHPKEPFFLWLHLYDAHDPYDPPEPYKTKYAAELYDGEVAYVDAEVGKFLGELRSRGLFDGAVIAVMADHGESLGAHGEDFHGFFLYDETIQVPLVIKLPGANSAEERVDNRVELVDVLPTILRAAKIPVPKEVQGESLLGLMTTSATTANPLEGSDANTISAFQNRLAFSESEYGERAYGWSALRALRTGKYLYVQAPRRELYDRLADPRAEHNLASTSVAIADTISAQLDSFLKTTSNSHNSAKIAVDPQAQEKLAALGYEATSDIDPKLIAGDVKELKPDPKDKIQIGNLIHRANFLLEEGNFAQAVPILRELVAKEPSMVLLYAKLGQCLMLMKDYAQAAPVLRKLVEVNPGSIEGHFQLGETLLASKDFAGAEPEFELVVAKSPQWEKAHFFLATAYFNDHRLPEAIKESSKVLEISPDHYGANLLLGRSLMFSGKPEDALPKLKKAATLQPNSPEPHLALANAYSKLGKDVEAAREQGEAKQLAAAGR
jgi:arylsulfatase A-like enzyme/Flp pilus assembly protein TadD